MTFFSDDQLTQDAFLGGRLQLWQPRSGYRAGVDPVLLAASVSILPGQSVLELGCGAGQILFCLGTRVAELDLTGVELQPEYGDLARRNGAFNKIDVEVHTADLAALPDTVRQRSFDHVIMNPPYFRKGAHSSAVDSGRAIALGESTPLELWFQTAAKRLKPRGYLHVVQRTDRLPEMVNSCAGKLGSIEVLPLSARAGSAPDLVILRARKEGRAPFQLHAPFVLHTGDRHQNDAESYRPEVSAILRQGAPLVWPT